MRISQTDLLNSIEKMQKRRILIVGDVGIDEYVIGNVRRISPEAPVPVLEVAEESTRLGLSTNVAQNVSALQCEPLLVSVVGDDAFAENLRHELRKAQVSVDHLIVDRSRPTTRKLRVMAQQHHLVRVDYEQRRFLDAAVEQAVLARVADLMPQCDGVILQDYAKGVLSESLAQGAIALARQHGKRVLVDPNKLTPLAFYRGADLMTPNADESLALAGIATEALRAFTPERVEVGQALMRGIQSQRMVITRGKDGMSLFEEGRVQRIPTYARQVFDVTGAGDTVIAALTVAWTSGLDLPISCVLANFAAGHVVSKVGCVPCSTVELVEFIKNHPAEVKFDTTDLPEEPNRP